MVAVVQHRAVLCLERHVVFLVREQDQIILLKMHRADDRLKQLRPRFLVLKIRIAELHQQPVLVGIGDLRRAERKIEPVFIRRAGEDFFQQREIFFLVLLAHQGHGLAELGQNFPAAGHIAAVDSGDVRAVGLITAAKLAGFLIGHGNTPS